MVLLNVQFYESVPLTVGVCLLAAVAGLFAGSAIYNIMWRQAHDSSESGITPSCHECGHPLSLRESLPVVGWLLNQGVCPHCGNPLGGERLCCELLCGGIFVSIVLRYGPCAQAVEVLAICCVLLAIALSTLWNYRVPNVCIALAALIRIVYLAFLCATSPMGPQLVVSSIVGAAALGIPLAASVFLSNALLARDITGSGTVKLVAIVGFYLGWQQGLFAIAGAVILLVLIWILSPNKVLEVEVEGGAHRNASDTGQVVMPSVRDLKATMEEDIAEPIRTIPFAPAIAIACWVVLLLGVDPAAWNAPLF